MKVLILEDVPVQAKQLAMMLKKNLDSLEITLCESLAALPDLKGHPFELAFVDINLLDGRGDTVIPDLVSGGPSCTVVVMSTDSEKENLLGALSLGASSFLIKPLLSKDINDLVHHLKS